MVLSLLALVAVTDSNMADSISMKKRASDWRNGAVVYQVFIDRFAPPKSLESKRKFISAPRSLHEWSDLPKPGKPDPELGLWSHELEFWGGDIQSLTGKLEYIQNLGADVLYLQPIHAAFTNHKYDAQDYTKLSPEIGTRQDLVGLIKNVHGRKMKIMLDGVFNHMGRTSPMFQEALKNPKSPHRDWYYFGEKYPNGYHGWVGVANMPMLHLENKALRDYLWNNKDSVVKQYLADGIDGWRLDVAFELGPTHLEELTKEAHKAKPGSAVVGEISGYPSDWFNAVDGVFNFFAANTVKESMTGKMSGGRVGRILGEMVADAGIENLLKSWTLVDNHDTPRIASAVPVLAQRQLVQTLQFALPGCPVVYYGSELGMTGPDDPTNRAPMRWDLVTPTNPDLTLIKRLITIRKAHPALRYGDITPLQTDQLIGFTRTTDKLRDTVVVLSNPTAKVVKETIPCRVGRFMSWGELKDVFTGQSVRSITGLMTVEIKPYTTLILVPITEPVDGFSPYNRVG